MFTLEKRLRLEERSRDLAEENVRREVSSCQGLLQASPGVALEFAPVCVLWWVSSPQALIPLCEDDNQSMEIILRLQKNLDILIQSMTRVSSRSEMLGAIHQVGKCTGFSSTRGCAVVWFTWWWLTVRRVALVKPWRWWSSTWRTWGGCTRRSTPSCWSWERR